MQRILANYTVASGRGLLVNHVTTIDNGRLLALEPIDDERACTRYEPRVMCLVPTAACTDELLRLITGAATRTQLATLLTSLPPLKTGTPVTIVASRVTE